MSCKSLGRPGLPQGTVGFDAYQSAEIMSLGPGNEIFAQRDKCAPAEVVNQTDDADVPTAFAFPMHLNDDLVFGSRRTLDNKRRQACVNQAAQFDIRHPPIFINSWRTTVVASLRFM